MGTEIPTLKRKSSMQNIGHKTIPICNHVFKFAMLRHILRLTLNYIQFSCRSLASMVCSAATADSKKPCIVLGYSKGRCFGVTFYIMATWSEIEAKNCQV